MQINGGMVWEVMAHSQNRDFDLQKKNLQLLRAKSLAMYVTTYDSLLYVYIFTYTYVWQ